MKRGLAPLVVVAVLAACGTTVHSPAARLGALSSSGGGDLSTTGGSTSTGSSTAEGPAPGGGSASAGPSGTVGVGTSPSDVTGPASVASPGAQTGPLEIGFVRTGVSNAAAFGASLGNTVSEAQVDSALVAAFNDRGGIAGRKIVPVYADTDTGSSSWDADFQAACAKFTQDNHVVAVLGYVFNHDDAFETCLARRQIPHLSTTFNVPDAGVLAQYPLLFALSTPRIERRTIEKIDGGIATGILTKASKIGVLYDSCPGTQRAWTNVALPYIKARGLDVAASAQFGCARGSGDAGSEAAQAGNVVLQFRSKGVDTIIFAAVSEGPPLLVFGNAAEAQGWHPKYVVSSLANAAVLANQIPAGQAANVYGYGWMPAQDVKPAQWPGMTTSQQRCVGLLKQKGIVLTSATDYLYGFNVCEAMFVYELALTATHGHSDGPAVAAAVEALGSSYVSALNLNGKSTYSHAQHDAPSLARYFAWDHGCACFTYRSTLVPIT